MGFKLIEYRIRLEEIVIIFESFFRGSKSYMGLVIKEKGYRCDFIYI